MIRSRLSIILALLALAGCENFNNGTKPQEPSIAHSLEAFDGPVRKVLEHRCVHCHSDKTPSGGLNLQNRDLVFSGNGAGPFLVPGNAAESRIWQAIIKPNTHPRVMPGDGWGLTLESRQAFEAWINSGAFWPEGEKGKLEVKPYEVEVEGYL